MLWKKNYKEIKICIIEYFFFKLFFWFINFNVLLNYFYFFFIIDKLLWRVLIVYCVINCLLFGEFYVFILYMKIFILIYWLVWWSGIKSVIFIFVMYCLCESRWCVCVLWVGIWMFDLMMKLYNWGIVELVMILN